MTSKAGIINHKQQSHTHQTDLRELSKTCQDVVGRLGGISNIYLLYNKSYNYWKHLFKGAEFRAMYNKVMEARLSYVQCNKHSPGTY